MDTMKAPKWLGDIARKKWKELEPKAKSLSESTADLFGLLCQSWDDYLTALAAITKDGQVIRSGERLFINPACNEKREAWKQIVKLSGVFGFSPDITRDEDPGEFTV